MAIAPRTTSRWAKVAGVVVLAVVLLLLVAAVGLRGLGGEEGDGPAGERRPGRPAPAPSASEPPAPELPSAELALVEVTATEPDAFPPDVVVSGVRPPAVVRVRAGGFDTFESGSVTRCVVTGPGAASRCTPPFPVQFDEDGRADFQFQVSGSPTNGACEWGRPTCMLLVRGSASGLVATANVVSGDVPAPARVTVDPSTDLVEGQVVRVSVSGLPPGAGARAVMCAPPGYAPGRCGTPTAVFVLDGTGSGSTALSVGPCAPRSRCGVVVVTDEGFVGPPIVALRFSRGPGAAYEPGRLAAGLGVAAALLALAVILVRRTDWRRPTEAATPAMDGSDLETERSLDDLFGTDEELDASDPVRL